MKNEMYQEIELSKKSLNWGMFKAVSLVLFLIGAAAFLYELHAGDAKRAWSAYLTNYVYWTGLAFGAFLLSPILVSTNATWGRPVKRLSESVVFFLPVSFILLWPLFLGRADAFWWVLHPEEQKAPWLNTPFFFAREASGCWPSPLRRSCSLIIPSRATWNIWKRSPARRTAGTLRQPFRSHTSSSMLSL